MKYFVSYSRHDSEFVKQLASDLKKMNLNIWLDQLDIPVGSKWDTCIEAALNESIGIILVLSESSVKSDNVMDEVNFAISKSKHIIPILLDDCEVPFRIARIQQIDFREGYEKRIHDILATVSAHNNALPPEDHEKVVSKPGIKHHPDTPHPAIEHEATVPLHEKTDAELVRDIIIEDVTYSDYAAPEHKVYNNPPNPVPNVPHPAGTSHGAGAKFLKADTESFRNRADYYTKTQAKTIGVENNRPGFMYRLSTVKFHLIITLALLGFLFWLFNTTSGTEFYASISGSVKDLNVTDDKQFIPEIAMILIVGAIAGWIAGAVIDSDSHNFFVDLGIGIVGGIVANKFIFHGLLALTANYYANVVITATIGAIILSLVIKLVRSIIGF